MSRENVERVHRAYDAFRRRDLDALLALMHPDVEAASRLVAIEGGYHGHEGIRRWWSDLYDVFPDLNTEVVEVRDRGELTISALCQSGHGAGSESPVEQRLWHVAEWRDGKMVWWSTYPTEAEALEAVGLRE